MFSTIRGFEFETYLKRDNLFYLLDVWVLMHILVGMLNVCGLWNTQTNMIDIPLRYRVPLEFRLFLEVSFALRTYKQYNMFTY